jgi:hypothetical protein
MLIVRRTQLYLGRLIAGFGVGAASMLTPLYVSAAYFEGCNLD